MCDVVKTEQWGQLIFTSQNHNYSRIVIAKHGYQLRVFDVLHSGLEYLTKSYMDVTWYKILA